MKTVLITGPIGSGKSEVRRYLESEGFPVYDCDSRTKALYDAIPGLKARIEVELGISWSQIGVIFTDAARRQKLESIVYPFVVRDILEWKSGLMSRLAFIESAVAMDKVKTAVVWTHDPEPSYSSGGNMNNAYRVLFNDGATTLSVQTDLSSGDKLTKPETPVKDGYTFAGWYKDSACTQGWDFETGISGDMTLYAKWTAAGSSGETEATATPTATSTAVTTPQPTKTQTAAATTSAPEATTASGVSPTLTQAPAPVAGALFGLLAAGVLLRRRFQ